MTTLPDLSQPFDLEIADIEAFRARGHVQLRALASRAEVAAYRPLIDAATEQHRYDRRPLAERDTYGRAFQQAANLWRRDARIAGFTLSARFGRVAAALLGCSSVRLYHDQALYKEPGGGFTPWHQDQTYWPLATAHTVTLWMPLVDVAAGMGTLRFVAGSHVEGDWGVAGIGDASEVHLARRIDETGAVIDEAGAMAAGDASFHAGWTVHGAHPNRTQAVRAAMTIIYFADGTRVAEPTDLQRFDLKTWLPGLAPGDLAASHKNPRVGTRD